ncbi:MFS transporter [Streptomyces sp. NPDC020917]|uniref:MFS transporter n=1 Tax=Streptomyces sp. NPDC020917 TaxID=3365102 RepID=UPI0037B2B39F
MRIRVVVLITAFTVVMAGPNLPTPLLPGYRAAFGLGAFGLTVLFSTYLFVLVGVLSSAGRAARRGSPRALLLAGLLLGVVSDVCLAWGASALAGVLAGRALSGLAVGLSTGATAVLLRHHGQARSASATALCALLGSAVGTALTATLAQYLPWPRTLSYLVHAGFSLACAAFVASRREFAEPRRTDTIGPGTSGPGGSVVRQGQLGRFAVASATGVGAWVTAGMVVALVPTYAAELLGATNLVVAVSPVVLYLLAACAGSLVAGRRPARLELAAAPALMAMGLALTALSGPVRSTAVLLSGAIVTGVGQGLGFRGGLFAALMVSAAGREGAATSRFSALAYFGAAVTTLGMGLLTGRLGLDVAFRWAAVLFAAFALVLGVLARRLFAAHTAEPAGRNKAGTAVGR